MAHGRYLRPYLEIEYDRQALTQENVCCRYVLVVVRLCFVPEDAKMTMIFERVRKQNPDGTYLDAYEVHPHQLWKLRKNTAIAGYHEYQVQLLARPNEEETGLIHIKIESQSGGLLSEIVYRFDSRFQEPCSSNLHPKSFRGVRTLPFIRTPEARDALRGQYPASPPLGPAAVAAAVPSPDQPREGSSPLRNYWIAGATDKSDLGVAGA